MKRFMAFIIILLIVFGWYVSLFGLHAGGVDIKPIGQSLKLGLDLKGGVYVVLEANTDLEGAELKKLMQQTQQVIERRVNAMGLSEPVVTIEGENRIRVELPGAENVEEAAAAIGTTAQLYFVKPDGTIVLTGDQVKDASMTTDTEHGGFAVALSFNSQGSDAFYEATAELSKKSGATMVESEMFGSVPDNVIMIVLDGEVISMPSVNTAISGNALITGSFDDKEAASLAALIRGGALPVDLVEVSSSLIGPTLGMDALRGSVIAGCIGVGLIFIFMIVVYRLMGLTANIALLLYIPIVLWVMVLSEAVLTLPGIAGIILSIGMAVDANVIIFSRIQEEVAVNGKSLRVGVSSGFKRALGTIIDSNLTTVITGLVLFLLGSGTVKGFAATLLIGIFTSFFTAAVVTQLFLVVFAESKSFSRHQKTFGIIHYRLKKDFKIIESRKIFYIISVSVIVIGLSVGFIRGFNLGMDFTGGTMIQIDIGKEVTVNEIKQITKAQGIDAEVIHAGEHNEQIIIKTQQALQSEEREELYADIFEKYELDKDSIVQSEVFGPSIGESLRKNSVRAVVIAMAGILIYVAFRFEWRFGVASIVALVHDVLMMTALFGLLHFTINTPFIASMLIIFGYSVNNTVVIFDRIRENLKLFPRMKTHEQVDLSVNQTVIRSLATSFTTLLAIITLFVVGVSTIREFTLPLIVGIATGTVASIFIASPIWYELVQVTKKRKYKGKQGKQSNKE